MSDTCASPGKRLKTFMEDEDNFVRFSWPELQNELIFFDQLDQIMLDFLNREHHLRDGESKYYALCSLARTQTIKACNNILRRHVGDAFNASRLATDAALFSVVMSMGLLSESDYLNNRKARDNAFRRLGQLDASAEELPQFISALRTIRSDHSAHAHADPIALANRITNYADGTVQYSGFQDVKDPLQLKYYFMGMLWVGAACLRAFLHIQETEFNEDVSRLLARLSQFKQSLHSHRCAVGLFPDLPLSEGF